MNENINENIKSMQDTQCIIQASLYDVLRMSAIAMGGMRPYIIIFKKNGIELPSGMFTDVNDGEERIYDYVVDELPTTLESTVIDSCPYGQKTYIKSCQVIACNDPYIYFSVYKLQQE